MPTKLQKVFGTVKDQTSVTLAFLALRGSSSSLEVAVLRATSHDEVPGQDRYATKVMLLASASPQAAAEVAMALRRRISKTSSWVVALKSLNVIYNIILDASPDFRREAAMHRLLDLSSFRSTPWDFTAFVRTYALYLDARLQASLQGYISLRSQRRSTTSLKPGIMLDKIQQWQRLLDRAVGTRPTGPAKTNHLVHTSLRSIIYESFDLYHDVSEGLSILLDNFSQLPYATCVTTAEACRITAKLFEDLEDFYQLCKQMGIGKASEYPKVQKISKKLLETLNEFLKGHKDANNPASDRIKNPPELRLSTPRKSGSEMTVAKRQASLDVRQKRLEPGSPTPASSSSQSKVNADSGSTFERSAWIQKLDERSRQQLIEDRQQWIQHQNRLMQRNLTFLMISGCFEFCINLNIQDSLNRLFRHSELLSYCLAIRRKASILF